LKSHARRYRHQPAGPLTGTPEPRSHPKLPATLITPFWHAGSSAQKMLQTNDAWIVLLLGTITVAGPSQGDLPELMSGLVATSW